MGMLREFRDFAARGNVIDLAVGVVIGAAFGKIVNSFVADVLMPPIGLALKQVDFKDIKIHLANAVMEGDKVTKPEVSINIGLFLNVVIEFVIIAFCVFLVVKVFNMLRKKDEAVPAPPPAPSNEEKLLIEIRDALRSR